MPMPATLAPLRATRPTGATPARPVRLTPRPARACRDCVSAAVATAERALPAPHTLLRRSSPALAAVGPAGGGPPLPDEDEDDGAPSSSSSTDPMQPAAGDAPPLVAALAALRLYKAAISPLLPPSCRFLPTCSEYAARAYREFGIGKGTVLTAWRLARCNPLGGRGWDPPTWPPPGFRAGE
jgi:putative membrane protein insertion efficiency factor